MTGRGNGDSWLNEYIGDDYGVTVGRHCIIFGGAKADCCFIKHALHIKALWLTSSDHIPTSLIFQRGKFGLVTCHLVNDAAPEEVLVPIPTFERPCLASWE